MWLKGVCYEYLDTFITLTTWEIPRILAPGALGTRTKIKYTVLTINHNITGINLIKYVKDMYTETLLREI